MHRRSVPWGLAALLVLAAAGVAAHEFQSSRSSSTLTPVSVTQDFAARGLVLAPDPSFGLEPGSPAHAVGPVLTNRCRAVSQGVVIVIVTRSTAEAKGLLTRYQASKLASDASVCGSPDYRMWQARNVAASFSSCDYLDGVIREATAPAQAAVATVMAGLRR
jgi:hypothetical protein